MKTVLIRLFVTCCLIITGLSIEAQTAGRTLLLVAGMESSVGTLSHAEVRKLFLGAPITKENIRLKPVLNNSDELIREVFLQKIIFMSDRDYRRQLLSRVFRVGGSRPSEFTDLADLVNELNENPDSISFMWSEQFQGYGNLKSLGVLWSE